jgi:transcriptional regulator with PAS, ATPase and Fis domain
MPTLPNNRSQAAGVQQIAIVTHVLGTPLGTSLRRNLEEVLGDRLAIRNYALDSLGPDQRIEADLVLVLGKHRVLELRDHVAEPGRIQVVQRTIRQREVHRVLAIPDGTRVLVVNDAPGSTTEMVALLQQLGINHLQYVPYVQGGEFADLRVAVTPGEAQRVPAQIDTVIDVGHRCIDLSTFIEIISRLGLKDPEVDRNLRRYADSIVTLDRGIDNQYKELAIRNAELATVMDLSHEGILLLTPEGRVALCNQALAAMLHLSGPVTGATATAFPAEVRAILGRRQGGEWILDCQGRTLVVSRQDLVCFGEVAGSYFNFQEVTYIRKLEQNLSRKLREKGQTTRYRFADLLTRSGRMRQCIDLARRVAPSDFTVLITGESGTGKELLAQSIHAASPRARQPFVAVNCAAVPENLLESELFGYQGGSFTGALKDGKAGLFEQAHNGTVFLDEIGDMPLPLQAKLLRVLQERQVVRVGSQNVININIRVIAATNQDLRGRIRAGQFREDLFYRLNALELRVPPLRDRAEDVFLLLDHFLGEHGRGGLAFDPGAREVLVRHPWPGNIRELNNVAGHVAFMAGAGPVTVADLPGYLQDQAEAQAWGEGLDLFAPGTDLERVRAVLEALPAETGPGRGRRAVQALLAARGLALPEGEVRRLLAQMSAVGLVQSWSGRRGSQLTARGRLFLNGLKNGKKQVPIVLP